MGCVLCTVCPEVIDRGLWKESLGAVVHQALFILVVSLWTRLYISRSSCMSLVIFSTA